MTLKKEARKTSADPVQESLREHKAQWNKRVSTFISAVIALKKAINGQPVSILSLPKGNIKDPLPNAVPELLTKLTDHYARLMQEGQEIVKEQLEYSQNRQQPHDRQTFASNNDEITKEGANFFTRLLTYIKTPFMFDDEDRWLRKDILQASAELENVLLEVANNVVSKSERAIPIAIYKVQDLVNLFQVSIIEPLYSLNRQKQEETGLILEKPEESEILEEKTKTVENDKERFPMRVNFPFNDDYKKIEQLLDEIVGFSGIKDTSQLIRSKAGMTGFLRRVWRFDSREARQTAMLAINSANIADVEIVHPITNLKKQEVEPKQETIVEEKSLEPPKPDDLDLDNRVDSFEKRIQLQGWANELSVLPDKIPSILMKINEIGLLSSDVDNRVTELARLILSFNDSVRDVTIEEKLSDNQYKKFYHLYKEILDRFNYINNLANTKMAVFNNEDIKKLGQARITRWFKKHWLNLLRTKDYRIRQKIDNEITRADEQLNKFMNLLQQKNAPIEQLVEIILSFSMYLKNILDDILRLAETHNNKAKILNMKNKSRLPKNRRPNIEIIQQRDLSNINRMKRDLDMLSLKIKNKEG